MFRLWRNGKNWIQISFVNCFAIPNRRLLSQKTEFEFVRPYDLIPKYRAFCEARPAPASPCGINSGGASEQPNAPQFSECLNWSGRRESNSDHTNPNRAYYRCTTTRYRLFHYIRPVILQPNTKKQKLLYKPALLRRITDSVLIVQKQRSG